eukprot:scaffold2058_cov115-Cylindrotheca_fusiformis.AAC.17
MAVDAMHPQNKLGQEKSSTTCVTATYISSCVVRMTEMTFVLLDERYFPTTGHRHPNVPLRDHFQKITLIGTCKS